MNSDYLVSFGVPADLKDSPSSLVRVNQLSILGAPNVYTPVGWRTLKTNIGESECTCRSCHWRGTSHRGRTPRCTLAPCACVGTNFHLHSLVFLFLFLLSPSGDLVASLFKNWSDKALLRADKALLARHLGIRIKPSYTSKYDQKQLVPK